MPLTRVIEMADLASIGKHKRPPLPAARPPPFRADPVVDRILGHANNVGRMPPGTPKSSECVSEGLYFKERKYRRGHGKYLQRRGVGNSLKKARKCRKFRKLNVSNSFSRAAHPKFSPSELGESTSDTALLSSMMTRLAALEKQLQQSQKEMAHKVFTSLDPDPHTYIHSLNHSLTCTHSISQTSTFNSFYPFIHSLPTFSN